MYPCVVSEEDQNSRMHIGSLFGDLCCGTKFAYDEELKESILTSLPDDSSTQSSSRTSSGPDLNERIGDLNERTKVPGESLDDQMPYESANEPTEGKARSERDAETSARKRPAEECLKHDASTPSDHSANHGEADRDWTKYSCSRTNGQTGCKRNRAAGPDTEEALGLVSSQSNLVSQLDLGYSDGDRRRAYEAALDREGLGWHEVNLLSVADNHSKEEMEL